MCVGEKSSFGYSEGEVLLQRGTLFRIDKIDYKDRQYDIVLTVLGNAR